MFVGFMIDALNRDDQVVRAKSKGSLAILLQGRGTLESLERAEALYREVIAGQTVHYGKEHIETLTTKMNLAILSVAGLRFGFRMVC